jgi:hypothetical protein
VVDGGSRETETRGSLYVAAGLPAPATDFDARDRSHHLPLRKKRMTEFSAYGGVGAALVSVLVLPLVSVV